MPGYRRQLYRDDAVVLRVQKLGESDRIITLLTRRYGRVRAVARGVRRTTSRFGARLEPFGHVDLQIAGDQGAAGLHTVSQVEAIELYGKRVLDDYPRYTAASAVAETAERLTPVEHEPSLRLFLLTLGAMRALAAREHAGTLVLDAYLLRGMGTRAGRRRWRSARSAARRAAQGVLGAGRWGRCAPIAGRRVRPVRLRPRWT